MARLRLLHARDAWRQTLLSEAFGLFFTPMLQRLRQPAACAPSRRGERDRRYRRRQRDGAIVCPVVIDNEVIASLVRWRWLAPGQVDDRAAVADAVTRMLLDASRRK
jgi:hypothetical protein